MRCRRRRLNASRQSKLPHVPVLAGARNVDQRPPLQDVADEIAARINRECAWIESWSDGVTDLPKPYLIGAPNVSEKLCGHGSRRG